MADQATPAQAGQQSPSGGQGPIYPGYIPYRHARPAWAEQAGARREPPPLPWSARTRWWLAGALVAVAALIAIAAIASGGGGGGSGGSGGDERAQPETATATGAADPAAARPVDTGHEVHAVGQVAHTRSFDVTVVRVVDPYTPTTRWDTQRHTGYRLVAVEVQATNTTDQQLPLSTVGGTGLRDAQDRSWDVAIAGVDRPRLDGFVAPGETRRGWIVFEVATDATDLQLRLVGNLSATGSLFDLG